jgi:hypothetical protein
MPFIAFWSEKSNCTAVAKWFFHQIGLLDEALAYSPWIHDYEIQVFKSTEYIAKCLEAVNAGTPIIKFVRNPYARAFSGYLELCRAHPEEPDHWSIPLRRDVIASLMGVDSEVEYAFSFQQYLTWLETVDLEKINLHLSPQFRRFEGEFLVEPFRVELGAAGFANLEDRFKLRSSSDVPIIFQSDHYHRKVRASAATSVALARMGIPLQRSRDFLLFDPDISAVAHDSVGEQIRRLFRNDFEQYGYELLPPPTA